MSKKIGLIILDGFGINEKTENNAIKKANTPTFNNLFSKPFTHLKASEEFVGLPKGQMGNSEVGHMAIGSGRLLKQPLVEISDLFSDNSFQNFEEYKDAIKHCKKYKSKLHLFGLFGSGGVHAHIEHLVGIIQLIPENIKVCLHLFSDGRDLPKNSISGELEVFLLFLQDYSNVEITTISGRFYAMDRDNNWGRIQLAYNSIVYGENKVNISPIEFIEDNYDNKIYDEFFQPTNFTGNVVSSGDVIFHLNFRSDRAIQLIKAFIEGNDYFEKKDLKNLYITTMTKFYKEYEGNVFIKPVNIKNTLGEVLSSNNLTQLHIAETEKFAHVTKFFNGGKQIVFSGEKDILVASPKVKTYDMKPEMSAYEILENYKRECNNFDFTVINFANGDMVGHTGVMDAVIKTVEVLDNIVSQLLAISKENNIDLYITADHGNCEVMFDGHGNIVTSHTTNQVPFWYIKEGVFTELTQKYGTLANIAPTILENFEIEIPDEMNSSLN